jgi:hypothetical protein
MQARHALLCYTLQERHPKNSFRAVLGVAHPQGRLAAAIFYSVGYPTRYAYVFDTFCVTVWDGDIEKQKKEK